MDKKLVSIIIPAYNASDFIKQTLESALNQTYKNIEIILVDDGSTDDTIKIAEEIANKDCRLKIISQSNQGCSSAKNTGLLHINGDYVQYLDADDILGEDKIAAQLNTLTEKNKVSISRTFIFENIISTNTKYEVNPELIYSSNENYKFLANLYKNGGMIQPNAFLIPRLISDQTGLWDTTLSPATDEDSEYFCRVILASDGIQFEPNAYNFYRCIPNGASLSRIQSFDRINNSLKTIFKRRDYLLKASNTIDVKLAFAHLLSRFYYNYYDMHPSLAEMAKDEIIKLGFNHLPIEGGINFRKLARILGMEKAVKFRHLLLKYI